jgi:calcineurin-like phosphoesterase family protein
MIERFNSRVKEDDTVFYLGDFVFKSGSGRGEGESEKASEIRAKLKCKNIIFIEGNHDKHGKNSLKTPIRKVIIHYGGKNICMVHNPEHADFRYEINIVGHVHDKWKIKRLCSGTDFTDCINVGVEQWNYYPVTWNEIWQAYSQWVKNNG